MASHPDTVGEARPNERERAILDRQLHGIEAEGKPSKNLLAYATFADKVILSVSSLCTIISGALNPLVPLIYGLLVGVFNGFAAGTVTADEFRSKIAQFSLYYVYLSIAIFAFTYASTVGFYYSGERIARALRTAYLSAILRQNMAFFDLLGPGEITNRIMSDMGTAQEAVTSKLAVMLSALAQFAAAFIIAYVLFWKVALIISPFLVIMVATGITGGAYTIKHDGRAMDLYSQAAIIAEEAISAVKHVTAFGIESLIARRYISMLKQAGKADAKASNMVSAMISWSNSMPCLLYALSFWMGSKYLVKGEVSVFEITTTTLTIAIGAFAIARITPSAQAFTSGIAIAGAVLKAIGRRSPQDPLAARGEEFEDVVGDIRLQNLGLLYPSRDHVKILDDVTISFPAMKKTAIVGPSGSGKSSILGLVERFYEPTSGKVLLDGRDIQPLNLRWLRRQIALVDQNPVLFNASIFENIRYGDTEALNRISDSEVRERIIEASQKANAHDFITALPDGYETQVGEKGLQLSGGQRQRIAIARALIKDPKVLLLDEATSALDSKSEAAVQMALDAAAEHRTTIIIAHRLSTVRNADNIIVLVGGKVAEEGNHDALVAKNGVYAALVQKQHIEDTKGKDIAVESRTSIDDISNSMHQFEEDIKEADEVVHYPGTGAVRNEVLPASARRTLSFIKRMSKDDWKVILLGVVCAIFAGLGVPVQSVFFAKILTLLAVPESQLAQLPDQISFWSGLYVAMAAASFIFWMGVGMTMSYTTERLSRRVRNFCFNSVMVQDMEFFDETGNAPSALSSLLSKSTTDVTEMGGPIIGAIFTFIATILAGIILSLIVGWKFALVCTATIPFVVTCGFLRLQMLSSFDAKIRQSGLDAAAYAGELVRSVRTVSSLGLEEHALLRYDGFLAEQSAKSLRSILSASTLYAASQSLTYLCAALAFWYGGNLVASREYTIFQFYICFVSLISGSQIAGSIFLYAPDASKAIHASGELERIMDSKPKINTILHKAQEKEPKESPPPPSNSRASRIQFENVGFAYPSRPDRYVLNNFSITVEPGQTIALVGQSGSGKSTCVSLLERFYDPSHGRILVDGLNIRKLNVDEYRRNISLVSQETIVFAGTIRENVAIGLAGDDVSDEYILMACRQANILEFVQSLPEGLSTLVGTGGSMLSGGQKQRIAIARAFLRKPKILLLDEATSALDTESETIVQAAMDAVRKGRTTIMVAHRLSTVVNADVICVLQDGALLEIGTHEQLMERQGKYWDMVGMQDLH